MPSDAFYKLVEIMAKLRGPDGCPWDKEQTSATIAPYCLEEAYEVVDAIHEGDPSKLKDELGDLLLQVIFHAQMANEKGEFDVDGVIEAISSKLIRRHPHVFAKDETSAKTSDEVLKNWTKIKQKEGRKFILDGIPKALPALLRATRVSEKAASVGFDWSSPGDVWKKVIEEVKEVEEAGADLLAKEEELGDLLFALASYARHLEVDAETALRKATQKFEARFRKMEEESEKSGQLLHQMTPKELDALWNRVKRV